MPRNSAISATKTASGERRLSGRTMITSVLTPRANPKAMPTSVASHSGITQCKSGIVDPATIAVMNADSVAISPWAKLRSPVPRNTTTRPSATKA